MKKTIITLLSIAAVSAVNAQTLNYLGTDYHFTNWNSLTSGTAAYGNGVSNIVTTGGTQTDAGVSTFVASAYHNANVVGPDLEIAGVSMTQIDANGSVSARADSLTFQFSAPTTEFLIYTGGDGAFSNAFNLGNLDFSANAGLTLTELANYALPVGNTGKSFTTSGNVVTIDPLSTDQTTQLAGVWLAEFAAPTTSLQLDFDSFGNPTGDFSIDRMAITFAFIPEPSSAVLLGLGSLALLGRRKRS